MFYRPLGRTGLSVSEISMGCNRLGDPGSAYDDWAPLVRRALEAGVNLFDTANSYNQGRSEQILGDCWVTAPRPIYLATKCGVDTMTNDFTHRNFSKKRVIEQAEHSLRRLRRDTIDVFQLHSPSVTQLEDSDWAEGIALLKEQGKVHLAGISTSDNASGIWVIERGLADVVQIEYSLLDPEPEDRLLPLALEKGVGITVRTPLGRGILSGKFPAGQPIPPEQQWRRPVGDQLQLRLQRVDQFRFLDRPGQTLAQAALRFLLNNPAVSCAIPGARTDEQLEANLSASNGTGLTPEEITRVNEIRAAWNNAAR